MASTEDLVTDALYIGVTRPAMAFGVTYAALLVNGLVTIEMFLVTRNLLWLFVCLPIHGIFWLLCLSEPRFFDLLMLWGQTRGRTLGSHGRRWRAASYGALAIDLPRRNGRRRRVARAVTVATIEP